MPRRPRHKRHLTDAAWLVAWAFRGYPAVLPPLQLLTVPQRAFEIALKDRRRGRLLAGDRWTFTSRGYGTISGSHWQDGTFTFEVSDSTYVYFSVEKACVALWNKVKVLGLPAWYGKLVYHRYKRPDWYRAPYQKVRRVSRQQEPINSPEKWDHVP